MISQKIIFGCNHVINTLRREVVSVTATRASSGDVDNVVTGGTMSQILYVYMVQESNPVVNYKPVTDYRLSDGHIEWLSDHRPTSLQQYVVEAVIISRSISDYTGQPSNCERCAGQGWYVDDFSDSMRTFQKVHGISKLVQDYIKILYTSKDSTGYGTVITSLSGVPIFNENTYLSEVGNAFSDAENQLKIIQAGFDSSNVIPEELLSSVDILSSTYDKSNGASYFSIKLSSMAPNSFATINFKF